MISEAAEEDADEHRRETRDHDQHRVAEDMAVKTRRSFRPLALAVITYCFLISSRKLFFVRSVSEGEGRDGRGQHRQRDVPEVIGDLPDQRHVLPPVGHQPPQREDLQIPPAREQHEQQDREQEPRDRVGHDDQARGEGVEARAVAHRLADAQRDRHEIGDQPSTTGPA
jgi:hypothetical protein